MIKANYVSAYISAKLSAEARSRLYRRDTFFLRSNSQWNDGSALEWRIFSVGKRSTRFIRLDQMGVLFAPLQTQDLNIRVCVLKKFGVCIRISVHMLHQFDVCVFFLIFTLLTEVNVLFLRLCNCQQNYNNCELRSQWTQFIATFKWNDTISCTKLQIPDNFICAIDWTRWIATSVHYVNYTRCQLKFDSVGC